MIHPDRPLTGKEVDARYYQRNRKRIMARNKKYAEAHKEQIKARTHDWYVRRKLLARMNS